MKNALLELLLLSVEKHFPALAVSLELDQTFCFLE